MMKFTDVHSHILWGVDDGIKTKEEALMSLQKAMAGGINRIFVTPHVIPGKTDREDIDKMESRFDELKQAAANYGIELYKGCELYINRHLGNWIEENLFHFMGDSRYLLCEFDPRRDVDELGDAEELLYELTLKNTVPIIAHAERAFHRKADTDRVREWRNMGCVIQVNRSSIVGIHGKEAKANAAKLIRSGLCHLIGSDAHEAEGQRTPKLQDAYDLILKKYGEETADILFVRNPQSLIDGTEMQSIRAKEKFGFFK